MRACVFPSLAKYIKNVIIILPQILLLSLLSGLITVSDWSQVMTSVFQMELPWRSIASKLVTFNEDGLIKYISTLDEYKLESKYDEVRLYTCTRKKYFICLRSFVHKYTQPTKSSRFVVRSVYDNGV